MTNGNKKALKSVVMVILCFLAYVLVPIPSAKTPNSELALNTWANSESAKLALVGYKGASNADSAEVIVHDQALCVYRDGNRVPDVLTFKYDNIVALGVLVFLFATIWLFVDYWPKNGKELMNNIQALLLGACTFMIIFVSRGVWFGMYVHSHPVEEIGRFDNPIRVVMLLTMMLAIVARTAKRHDSSNEER